MTQDSINFLKAAGVLSEPRELSKLLRAIASGTDAKKHRHDTILVAAAEMIDAFARQPVQRRRPWGIP